MSQIILDMGSGNTCGNSIDYAKRMIDVVADMDAHKHGREIVLKWQLEQEGPPGQMALDHDVFRAAFDHADRRGYRTTSSVFDVQSLLFLLTYGTALPFVKLACRPDLYYLQAYVPRGIACYFSLEHGQQLGYYCGNDKILLCVPKYPATLAEYHHAAWGYSDHAPGLELWNYYHPFVWEKHFVLERSPVNPDSGVFALTPDQLAEVIG